MNLVLTKINSYRKPLVWGLLSLIVVLAFSYAYCINQTVFNAVALQKSQSTLAHADSEYSDLESQYISLKNTVTLDYAYAHGFKDSTESQKFIAKKSLAQAFSFNAI